MSHDTQTKPDSFFSLDADDQISHCYIFGRFTPLQVQHKNVLTGSLMSLLFAPQGVLED